MLNATRWNKCVVYLFDSYLPNLHDLHGSSDSVEMQTSSLVVLQNQICCDRSTKLTFKMLLYGPLNSARKPNFFQGFFPKTSTCLVYYGKYTLLETKTSDVFFPCGTANYLNYITIIYKLVLLTYTILGCLPWHSLNHGHGFIGYPLQIHSVRLGKESSNWAGLPTNHLAVRNPAIFPAILTGY